MRRWFVGALAPLSLLLLLAAPAAAQTCVGSCGTDVANGDVTVPTGFSSYTYITTNGGVAGAGSLGVGGETDGSQLTTAVFSATAGSQLQYDFNYITSDGSGYPDYAWAELETSTGTPVALLFTARTEPSGNIVPGNGLPATSPGVTLNPGSVVITPGSGTGCGGPFNNSPGCNSPAGGPVWSELGQWSGTCWAAGCGLTGWVTSDYTIAAAGNYELVFGVTNTNDTNFDSGLAIDGVTIAGNPIATTPEPSTFLMLGLGISTLVMVRRRKLAL